MSESFDPSARSVLVRVRVWSRSGNHTFRFATDTGATQTLFSAECARLMGFDSPRGRDFKIVVSDTQAYRQFGNSVVVPVVKAVAAEIQPFLAEALRPSKLAAGR